MSGLAAELLLPVADIGAPEAVLSAVLRAGFRPEHFLAVLSAKEKGVVTAACLGAAAGACALPLRVAVVSRDKALQKQLVASAGIPAAKVLFVGSPSGLAASAVVGEPFRPVVVKPLRGVACGATEIITSMEALDRYTAAWAATDGEILVEERVDFAEEWHLDGVVRDGRLEFLSVGRYVTPCLDVTRGFATQLFVFDPERSADRYRLARTFSAATLDALGLRDGVFHLEAFYRPEKEELWFGECAARPGGGGIPDVVRHKFGVDLAGRGLDAVLARPPALLGAPIAGAVGKVSLPALPGAVTAAPTTDELLALPQVVDGQINVSVGSWMADMRRENRPHGGLAVLAADDEPALLRRMAEVVEWFARRTRIRTDTERETTLLAQGAALGCGFTGVSG
ncbi:hypothetical protein AB0J90_18375 [Micromonospora sp. NPDC049523]|uniref:ATP-grasp domain-containing protein n=1 Tax=Micromonospora sp. NPDC049523 TaxID=3155921 RepID=UPI00343285CB